MGKRPTDFQLWKQQKSGAFGNTNRGGAIYEVATELVQESLLSSPFFVRYSEVSEAKSLRFQFIKVYNGL